MNVSVRKLEILLGVARLESVTKAADELRLTQSAVSMALTGLERDAGGQLFKRIGKRMILNERGRMILPEAEAALAGVRSFDALLSPSGGLRGDLRIGASTTIGNYLLPSIVADFARANPEVRVSMQVGNTAQMCAELADGNIDLALVEGPVHLHSLDVKKWRGDELVVIVNRDDEWLHHRRVTAKMLSAAKWIMRERGSGTREVFEKAMQERVDRYKVLLELGHTEAIKKAVEAGLGASCLSRLAVSRELEHGWLYEVRTPLKLKRDLSLVTNAHAGGSQLVDACEKFLMRNAAP
jgi:DNA-binding transcriptional LysR family regulator